MSDCVLEQRVKLDTGRAKGAGYAAMNADVLKEGLQPQPIPLRADEIEVLRHRNCPAFYVARTPTGELTIACDFHPEERSDA